MTLIKPALSYKSTILPFDLNLVYNTAFSNLYFSNDDTNGHDLNTVNYQNMLIASGWKLSAQESIIEKEVANRNVTTTYLVYNDSDGTEHYFHRKDNSAIIFEDEDGLDLTITKDDKYYYLTDENENKKTFQNGYLSKIEDEHGNSIYIMYNNNTNPENNNITNQTNQITSIISEPAGMTAKTIFTFIYKDDIYLEEIRDAYGNRCYLSTAETNSSGKMQLLEVQHYNNETETYVTNAKYSYTSGHLGMMQAYDVETKNGIGYFYETSPTGQRINEYYGYHASSIGGYPTISETVKVESDELRQTIYRNDGNDGTIGNADDQITKYLFNGAGQTVNVMSEDTEGNLLGVTASAYTENNGTDNTNNRLISSVSTGQAGQNMFSNGGFELPADGDSAYPTSIATGWSSSGTVARRIDSTATGESHSGMMHYNLYNSSATGTSRIYRSVTQKEIRSNFTDYRNMFCCHLKQFWKPLVPILHGQMKIQPR